jgi:hypothetical protein
MIIEDYVSFETSKLLKEKGFDQNCATYYLDGQVWRHYHGEVIPKGKQIYAAPTQAVAMKWLREEHNLFIQVNIVPHTTITMEQKYYLFSIHKDRRRLRRNDVPTNYYNTYEQACEIAIKYCLENLI